MKRDWKPISRVARGASKWEREARWGMGRATATPTAWHMKLRDRTKINGEAIERRLEKKE